VNAKQNYFSAPQQLNGAGIIQGHSHVVVEKLDSLKQTRPTDPTKFAFFKGLNGKADGAGVLTADVASGLPAGVYKVSSINTAANHQPCLGPVAQHGSFDDVVYFTVTDSGAAVPPTDTGAAQPAATGGKGKGALAGATTSSGAVPIDSAAVAVPTGGAEVVPPAAAGGKGGKGKGKGGKGRGHRMN